VVRDKKCGYRGKVPGFRVPAAPEHGGSAERVIRGGRGTGAVAGAPWLPRAGGAATAAALVAVVVTAVVVVAHDRYDGGLGEKKRPAFVLNPLNLLPRLGLYLENPFPGGVDAVVPKGFPEDVHGEETHVKGGQEPAADHGVQDDDAPSAKAAGGQAPTPTSSKVGFSHQTPRPAPA